MSTDEKPITRRGMQLRRSRARKAKADALAAAIAAVVPAKVTLPVVDRAMTLIFTGGTVTGFTDVGLALVESMSAEGRFQNFIAAAFEISRTAWNKLMGKGIEERPLRLAFERGQAVHEQDIAQRLLAAGVRFTPALMSYSKAKLGWREAEPVENKIENRINISIPAPMERGELLRALDQTEIADFRKDKTIPLKDVTPKPKALPAPSGPEPLDLPAVPERDSPDVTNMQAATAGWQAQRAAQAKPTDPYDINELQEERTAALLRERALRDRIRIQQSPQPISDAERKRDNFAT